MLAQHSARAGRAADASRHLQHPWLIPRAAFPALWLAFPALWHPFSSFLLSRRRGKLGRLFFFFPSMKKRVYSV